MKVASRLFLASLVFSALTSCDFIFSKEGVQPKKQATTRGLVVRECAPIVPDRPVMLATIPPESFRPDFTTCR